MYHYIILLNIRIGNIYAAGIYYNYESIWIIF